MEFGSISQIAYLGIIIGAVTSLIFILVFLYLLKNYVFSMLYRCPYCHNRYVTEFHANDIHKLQYYSQQSLEEAERSIKRGLYTDRICNKCRESWIHSHRRFIIKYLKHTQKKEQ